MMPGHKRVEFGAVPDGWTWSTIGEEFDVQLGKMVDAARNNGAAKPYLGNAAVRWGRIDVSEIQTVPLSQSDLGRFRLQRGDLLVCEGRGVGRSAVWEDQLPECYYQKALHRLRSRRGFDPRIMIALFQYWVDQGHLSNYVTESTIPHLTKEKLVTIPLAVPPLAEQQAIATALSDADALLDGLDRLIAKKRGLKQAAMQQLLTGQTRLPGFSGEWTRKRFGELASIRNQKVMPENVAPDTVCVELEHVGQGDGRLHDASTANHSTSAKYRFCAGDVLFGRLRSYLRKYWLADRDGICTTEIWPLMANPGQAVGQFILALVQGNHFVEAASMSYGTHMPRADWGVVRNFAVDCPAVDEQSAIAAVLSDMDAELTTLEARRDKTRLLKQGMMQELLTGRTRLV